MKNIVLFGGSNSVMVNGLQKGLREYANVTNLALGATTTNQNLYELYRERNQEAIQNADLIVFETNINSTAISSALVNDQTIDNICRIEQFFFKIYELNKPVCVLILPYFSKCAENAITINNLSVYLANLYGFNLVNMYEYYKERNLEEFANISGDCTDHQMLVIMRNLGKNISKNIDLFSKPNININNFILPDFKVITPNEMVKHGEFEIFNPKNSLFNEITYRLNEKNFLSLEKYKGWGNNWNAQLELR